MVLADVTELTTVSQSLIHQVSVSDRTNSHGSIFYGSGLNPLFIRSQFQILIKPSHKILFISPSQSLIHQVSDSDSKLVLFFQTLSKQSQSLIHQVSVSEKMDWSDYTQGGIGLNPLFIRSQFQIHNEMMVWQEEKESQSLIHQVSVSDMIITEKGWEKADESQSLIHQVSDSESALFFECKYRDLE